MLSLSLFVYSKINIDILYYTIEIRCYNRVESVVLGFQAQPRRSSQPRVSHRDLILTEFSVNVRSLAKKVAATL